MRITEDNVADQLQSQNPKALAYIMDTYSGSVYGLIYRILHAVAKREDIEECVSDVFVDVWQNAQAFNPQRGSLKTWVCMIAKYKALDYRRNLQRLRQHRERETDVALVSDDDPVETAFLAKEEADHLIATISTLNDLDRQIVYKRYFYYESIEQIAQHFGLSRQAVDNRLWRSRKAIKSAMLQNGKEDSL